MIVHVKPFLIAEKLFTKMQVHKQTEKFWGKKSHCSTNLCVLHMRLEVWVNRSCAKLQLFVVLILTLHEIFLRKCLNNKES